MPKLKSHSGAKKRVFRTGKGRIAFKRRGRGHLLQQKSKRQKHLPRTLVVSGVHQRALTSLAPYA
ncbi:MAG: 50S ribosomal protein L35 [Candidatus Peribacteraceae bacterium]|jgi:large subunit ribosomal protein L35|nr:50S ribosomal protein L35 [Candidatus Peribacteraceae bacterium]